MLVSLCLLSCAVTLGQTNRAEWQLSPQLTPGLELVYQGTYLDETLSPHVQHQRQYQLDASFLVLETRPKEWQAALMTTLSLQNPGQPLAKKDDGPMSVRLELVGVDQQGRIYGADRKPLLIPLKGPHTLECGFFPGSPLFRIGTHFMWEVAETGRPAQRWQIVGTERCCGISCIKIVGAQQSEEWDHVRADQSAWRRRDTLWILPQHNVAQKVERIIEWRDPARDQPTQRTTVRYELISKAKFPGSLFEQRRQEILTAKKFYDDSAALTRNPAQHRPQIETLLHRVNTYLEKPATPTYRKAFVHLKIVLEHAKKGESLVPILEEEPISPTTEALHLGQRAPDFVVSGLTSEQTFRLHAYLGKPVLVVFYNPATPTGKEVITFLKQLSQEQDNQLAIMAMAVTGEPELVRKQHKELQLKFPILDGNGMRLTFGAHDTPRFVLLDGRGFVCLAQTGWGLQTPYEITEELQRCKAKMP